MLFRVVENLRQLFNIKVEMKKSGRKLAADTRIATRTPRDAIGIHIPLGPMKEEYRTEEIDSSSSDES